MKALQFNVNVPKFLIIQVLRPIARVGKDKNKTLRGLRQRYQPSFPQGFADRITIHILSLRAGTRDLRRNCGNRQGSWQL